MTPAPDAQDEILLKARWVLPISAKPIQNGAVRVCGSRIADVGPAARVEASTGPGVERIEFGEAALLPGWVNVHTHLDLTLLRGFCEELEFFPWIRALTRVKYERLEPVDFALSARCGAIEAIRAGTTTVGDASDQGVVLDALLESGLRGIAYQEVFGPDPASCDAAVASLEAVLDEQQARATDRVRVGVSPHAPYTVSGPLFRRVGELAARRRLPVSVHVAESAAEGEFVRRGRGPFADYLRGRGIPWQGAGTSPIGYLAQNGLLETRPLLVHALDVDAADRRQVADAGASVAHCPKSNAKLAHGIAPLSEWLAAGVAVGLGTDGVVSNNSCDPLEEARFAVLLQRARGGAQALDVPRPDASSALELLTLGGARALGLDDETGSLEPGKRADLLALDLSGIEPAPVWGPEEAILFSATAREVRLTMVDGRILYRDQQVTTLDASSLLAELNARATRLRAH